MPSYRKITGCAALLFSVFLFSSCAVGDAKGLSGNEVPKLTPLSADFVIVGGGTAGCVLAHRLSENGRFSVLVLEAGGIPPEFMNIPANANAIRLMPDLTFQYSSVPQQHAGLGNNGGIMNFPLGRVLGGTSQINTMVFNRGNPLDYDNWANLTGDPSWRYSNMLPYFRKSETYRGQFPSETQHGFHGPIPVSFQKYAPGKEAWLGAGQDLGYEIRDANGPQEISFTPIEYSMRFGHRVSSYKGYIEPLRNIRGNLRIVLNASVTQLIFEGNSAVGVRFNTNGSHPQTGNIAIATREIILSAGAFGSPTLLMRSGIGLRNVLEPAGIQVIKELPVGENLQNHLGVPMYIMINNKSLSFDPARDLNPSTWELYKRFGEGPYTTVAGYCGQAFMSSSVAREEGRSTWPDIYIRLFSVTTRTGEFANNFVAPWETSIMPNVFLGREKSRGTVKLNPADVNGMPLIDFNYLADSRDEDIFYEAVKATLQIFEETETYQRLGARIFKEPLRACSDFAFRSEEYWRCYIRQVTNTANHPCGTCAMNSVVDSKLKVIGMNGLRVVDASIMPFITNANIQAPVYAIAEKASETILFDHSHTIDHY